MVPAGPHQGRGRRRAGAHHRGGRGAAAAAAQRGGLPAGRHRAGAGRAGARRALCAPPRLRPGAGPPAGGGGGARPAAAPARSGGTGLSRAFRPGAGLQLRPQLLRLQGGRQSRPLARNLCRRAGRRRADLAGGARAARDDLLQPPHQPHRHRDLPRAVAARAERVDVQEHRPGLHRRGRGRPCLAPLAAGDARRGLRLSARHRSIDRPGRAGPAAAHRAGRAVAPAPARRDPGRSAGARHEPHGGPPGRVDPADLAGLGDGRPAPGPAAGPVVGGPPGAGRLESTPASRTCSAPGAIP